MARNADVTVRRPEAKRVPEIKVTAWSKVGRVKAMANGRMNGTMMGEGVGIGLSPQDGVDSLPA
jgi:hypothetical protein